MQERCISHHGQIALPPQEETCRGCPRAACVSKPIHLLRGTDPPLVVTFRCYGARESCFPQQASSGSSHLPWCCSYSLTPAEGNSLGVMRRGCSGNWDSAVSISSLLDSFGMSNTPCTRNSNTSPLLHFSLLILHPLLAAEPPRASSELPTRAGFLPRDACAQGQHVPVAQRGGWVQCWGLTGTHRQEHGWGKPVSCG